MPAWRRKKTRKRRKTRSKKTRRMEKKRIKKRNWRESLKEVVFCPLVPSYILPFMAILG